MEKDHGAGDFKDLRPDKNMRLLSEREERRLEAVEQAVKDDDTGAGGPSGRKVDRIIGGKRDSDTRGREKSKK